MGKKYKLENRLFWGCIHSGKIRSDYINKTNVFLLLLTLGFFQWKYTTQWPSGGATDLTLSLTGLIWVISSLIHW